MTTPTWHRYLRGDNRLEPDGESVLVRFEDGRTHRVLVRETEETLEFSAIVARRARLREVEDVEIRVWRNNRLARLNGFRVDGNGRLVAFGWLPRAGLGVQEFRYVIHRVGIESDRMEFLLTGLDIE